MTRDLTSANIERGKKIGLILSHIVHHLIFCAKTLGLEEVFQRFLLLSVDMISTVVTLQREVTKSYLLMLLNSVSPAPFFIVTVISNVRLAETAPPTLDMTMTEMLSKGMYVAGLGTNMKLLSKQ